MIVPINTEHKKELFLFIILYLSLYLSFFFESRDAIDSPENYFFGSLLQNIGPYSDFVLRETIIEKFNNNFFQTLLNYDKTADRHSPVILMYFTIYRKIGLDFDTIRLLHLNVVPLCAYVFFKCLKIKYPNIKTGLLIILSLSFFLSPPIRSLGIWPDSRIYGLLFFIISIFFFIRFNNNKKFKDALYNTIFLCLASYISPNFSVFFILYFYNFFNHYRVTLKTLILLFINFICAMPAYYYLFELKVFFLSTTAIGDINLSTRLNLANKILLISSIVLFYFLPFMFSKEFISKYYKININLKKILISFFLTLFLFFFFSYRSNFTGGGIFFQFSNYVFKNNILFFLISFLSILLVVSLWNIDINNKILLFCLVLGNPQLTIYHKYFDPLLIVLFFLLFNFNVSIQKIFNMNFLKFLYFFYFSFLILNYLK